MKELRQKITDIINDKKCNSTENCEECSLGKKGCCTILSNCEAKSDKILELFNNEKYRKESEVSSEIWEELKDKNNCILMWEYGDGYLDCMKNLKEVLWKHGLEVEE